VFVVLGLIILFSTAVLWSHYESIVTRYEWLAKAGLALVDVIAIGLAIWHLYAKHAPLKVWCYVADAGIAAMMIVHAGAVLQMDSSTTKQIEQVKLATDAQVKLREADAKVEAARIKAAGEAATEVKKQTGSSSLAGRALKSAEAKKDKGASDALTKMASEIKPITFLSDAYMHGGVYYWPALIALGFFVVAIGISAFSEPHEDASPERSPEAKPEFESHDVTQTKPEPRPTSSIPAPAYGLRRPWPGKSAPPPARGNGMDKEPAPLLVEPAKRPRITVRSAPAESPAEGSEKGSEKGSVDGSGSGSPNDYAPEPVQGVSWEPNKKGGFEGWHTPPGATHRKDKTYLGYVNLKLLRQWENLPPADRERELEEWIRSKRTQKGIVH